MPVENVQPKSILKAKDEAITMKSKDSMMKHESDTGEGVIVGESNRIAIAAAKRVVAGPVDDSLKPFVLVGPSGSGKTRILSAIGAGVTSMHDGRTVISTTGEKFFASRKATAGEIRN